MRRMLIVLGCVCALAAPAWAGGDVAVFGAYGETVDTNASLGLGARVSLGGERAKFDLTSTWFRQASTTAPPVADEITLTPVELGGRYLFAPGGEFRPYVGAGLSYFLVTTRVGEADDELGFYVNGGFVLGQTQGARVFGEVIYRSADITADYGPAGKVDLDAGGLGVAVGLSFSF
jgi:opacity protein-like surface antigen